MLTLRSIYRDAILYALIIIELALTLILYYEDIDSYDLFHFCETFVSMLFMVLLLLLSRRLSRSEHLYRRGKLINSFNTGLYLYIDILTDKVECDRKVIELLGIKGSSIKLEDLCNTLGLRQWADINEYMDAAKNKRTIKGDGILCINDKYIQYTISVLNNAPLNMKGVLIWLHDITEYKQGEIELLSYLNKYRELSFELNNLVNNLPFPIWHKNTSGELILANHSLVKLAEKLGCDDSCGAINQVINSLTANEHDADITMVRRLITIDNESKNLNVAEICNPFFCEVSGFITNVDELERYKRESESFADITENVLKLSKYALLVLNSESEITLFNQVFLNTFNIEEEWLDSKPTFSALLDKMREKGTLPEVKNYREFKEEQLRLLQESMYSGHHLMYLPGGQTIKVSIIPLQYGKTILAYENITENLNLERMYNELLTVYKSTLDVLSEGITIYGQDGRLRTYNNVFLDIWGFDADNLSHCPHFKQILKLKSQSGIANETLQHLENKIISSIESREIAELMISVNNQDVEVIVKPMPDNTVLIKYNKVCAS